MQYNYDEKLSQQILALYQKYKQELISVNNEGAVFRQGKTCMLPNRTAEMLYMMVRELQPKNIIEFSPHEGWTSFWILKAFDKNAKGILHSFDIIPNAGNHLKHYPINVFNFNVGDVKQNLTDELVANCSFFFIDSEHTDVFARWYKEKILDKKVGTNSFVMIDDIIQHNPGCWNSESDFIQDYLKTNNKPFCSFNSGKFPDKFLALREVVKDLPQGHHTDFSGELTTIAFTL